MQTPFLASHLYGAFSLYRRSAIVESGGLFRPQFFMYGDDYELGIRLWANGYRLAVDPIDGGRHYGAATTGGSKENLYYRIKNETAVMVMYSGALSFLVVMRALGMIGYSFLRDQRDKARAFTDGLILGRKMRRTLSRRMKRATSYVPRTNFSLVDYVFMHSRKSTRADLQQCILDKMVSKYPID